MYTQDKKAFVLEIDCEIVKYSYDSIYRDTPYIMSSDCLLTFKILLCINGKRAVRKQFTASFKENDLCDNDTLAQKILTQFNGMQAIPDIYNCPYTLDRNPGDTIEIIFSEKAKEIFEFLKAYIPKLLEYMSK